MQARKYSQGGKKTEVNNATFLSRGFCSYVPPDDRTENHPDDWKKKNINMQT